jgi:hypothetical protein
VSSSLGHGAAHQGPGLHSTHGPPVAQEDGGIVPQGPSSGQGRGGNQGTVYGTALVLAQGYRGAVVTGVTLRRFPSAPLGCHPHGTRLCYTRSFEFIPIKP